MAQPRRAATSVARASANVKTVAGPRVRRCRVVRLRRPTAVQATAVCRRRTPGRVLVGLVDPWRAAAVGRAVAVPAVPWGAATGAARVAAAMAPAARRRAAVRVAVPVAARADRAAAPTPATPPVRPLRGGV